MSAEGAQRITDRALDIARRRVRADSAPYDLRAIYEATIAEPPEHAESAAELLDIALTAVPCLEPSPDSIESHARPARAEHVADRSKAARRVDDCLAQLADVDWAADEDELTGSAFARIMRDLVGLPSGHRPLGSRDRDLAESIAELAKDSMDESEWMASAAAGQ